MSPSPSPSPSPSAGTAMQKRVFALFVVSGALGLAYQVLWSKLVLLFVGVSSWSYGVVLAAFMAGLALGSRWVGHLADRVASPLRLFGFLELGVGLYAVAYVPLADAVEAVYGRFAAASPEQSGGMHGLALKALAAGLLLLPPTILMGGTWPALLKHCARSASDVGRRAAQLHAVNAAGAVMGALGAAFVLIPSLGVRASLMLLALGNALIGLVAIASSRGEGAGTAPVGPREGDTISRSFTGARDSQSADADADGEDNPRLRPLLVLLLIAGVLSFLDEIAWTRVFAMTMGSSTYTFAIVVAAFITGIALGGALLSRMQGRVARPLATLGWTQVGAGTLILLPMSALPLLPWAMGRMATHLDATPAAYVAWEALKLAACWAVMVPPTILIGMAVPLAVRASARRLSRLGLDAGRLYAWNTAGNVIGALAGGLLLLPALGMEGVLRASGVAAGVLGAGAIALDARSLRPRAVRLALGVAAALALAGALSPRWDPRWLSLVPFRHEPVPSFDVARRIVGSRTTLLFVDDPSTNLLVIGAAGEPGGREHEQARTLLVNGKPDASNLEDMSTQLLLGHLPLLLHSHPQDVLVIGLASGVTSGAVLLHPSVRRLDIVDIVQAMPRASDLFREWNGDPLKDPRTRFIADDARSYLTHATALYDVVISEPSNPWTAGTGSLFSRELYERGRRRLRPGGLYLQWCQTYELGDATLGAMIRTFRLVFPHVVAFEGASQDLLLVGSVEPVPLDAAALAARMAAPGVAEPLRRIDVQTAGQLLYLQVLSQVSVDWIASQSDLENTDDNLLLEHRGPRDLFLRLRPEIVRRLDERQLAAPSMAWPAGLGGPGVAQADAMLLRSKSFGSSGLLAANLAAWSRLTGMAPMDAAPMLPAGVVPADPAWRPETSEAVADELGQLARSGDDATLARRIGQERAGILIACALSAEQAARYEQALVEAAAGASGAPALRLDLFRADVLAAGRHRDEALKVLGDVIDREAATCADAVLATCRIDSGEPCTNAATTCFQRTRDDRFARLLRLRSGEP